MINLVGLFYLRWDACGASILGNNESLAPDHSNSLNSSLAALPLTLSLSASSTD